MSVAQYKNVSYGLTQPLSLEYQLPIIANRDPGVSDKAMVGTIWIRPSSNTYWVLTSIVANSATWTTFGGGGAGVFTDLTVTGTSDLQGDVAMGNNATIAGQLTVTSNVECQDVQASRDLLGAGNLAVDGNADIGGTVTIDGATTLNSTLEVASNITGQDVEATRDLLATRNLVMNGDADIGGSVTAETTITATTGAITAAAGNIVATLGNISATAGSISSGTTMAAGTSITAGTNIVSTGGNITASAGSVTAFTFLQAGGPAGPTIKVGAGDPNGVVTSAQGSLYLNTTGSAVNDRVWVNTNSGTAWTFVTTGS